MMKHSNETVGFGRCKTCKWWIDGLCDVINTFDAEKPGTQLEVVTRGGDDWGVTTQLRTGPEFGCVLHSEKLNQS